MKKILLFLAFIASFCVLYAQSTAEVTTFDGRRIKGDYVMGNDSVISIRITQNAEAFKQKYGSDIMRVRVDEIASLFMNGQEFVLYEGRFTSKKEIERKQKEQAKLAKQQQTIQRQTTDPNYVIGKAFKSTGAVSLGIGVPCLAAGIACVTAGHTMYVGKYSLSSDVTTKSQLLEAGYYLLPIGASLTIVGIPLYVHGKKIMDMNINYTGNGVGVALNF